MTCFTATMMGSQLDVLALLTAAAGPLAVRDLAAMTMTAPPSVALARRIRRMFTTSAGRSLQTVGSAGGDRYQFAHESLLAYAQADEDLNDPDFRRRIQRWAHQWQAAGWPTPAGGEKGTPQYLLDTYPGTLTQDTEQLVQLVSDIGWVEAAIASAGVDSVLGDLRRATAANTGKHCGRDGLGGRHRPSLQAAAAAAAGPATATFCGSCGWKQPNSPRTISLRISAAACSPGPALARCRGGQRNGLAGPRPVS